MNNKQGCCVSFGARLGSLCSPNLAIVSYCARLGCFTTLRGVAQTVAKGQWAWACVVASAVRGTT